MSREELIGRFESLPPEGQERVIDFIERLGQLYRQPQDTGGGAGRNSPEGFIGMWSDREDLADSSAWVRSSRKREWVKPLE
ncbi:MAG TPA: hypothetical protein VI756_12745 [Blastocatellia bacterium]